MKTNRNFRALGASLILATPFSVVVSAQELPGAADLMSEVEPAPSVSRADQTFFEKAALSSMKEAAISRAVVARLSNPEVKEFAQLMMSDHSGASAELRMLANRKTVLLPPNDMKLHEKWSEKTADDLDEDYIEQMVSDHKEAVDIFEKATRSVDADISAFASKKLPVLQGHLKKAQELEEKLD